MEPHDMEMDSKVLDATVAPCPSCAEHEAVGRELAGRMVIYSITSVKRGVCCMCDRTTPDACYICEMFKQLVDEEIAESRRRSKDEGG